MVKEAWGVIHFYNYVLLLHLMFMTRTQGMQPLVSITSEKAAVSSMEAYGLLKALKGRHWEPPVLVLTLP